MSDASPAPSTENESVEAPVVERSTVPSDSVGTPPEENSVATPSGEEPVVKPSEEGPVQTLLKEKPVERLSKKEPIATTKKEEPVASTKKEELVATTNTEEPVATTKKQDLLVTTKIEEPVATTKQEEPVTTISKDATVARPVEHKVADEIPSLMTGVSFSSWGFNDVFKNAGQTLYDSGADLAERSKNLVNATFGLTETALKPNTVLEVDIPDELKSTTPSFSPPVDCVFNADTSEVSVSVNVPGLEKNDVEVLVEDTILSFSGCLSTDIAQPDGSLKPADSLTVFQKERPSGHFHRCFRLPPNVVEGAIEAVVENGILDIKIKCTPIETPPDETAT